MLSPGTHHERVPADPKANLAWRLELLARVRRGGPAAERAVRQMCREDLLFYVSAFVWQINPNRLGTEVGPFVPWAWQPGLFRRLLAAITDRKDFLIEKSRDMGATWMCVILFDWLARFFPNKKFLVVSRNADAVDDADDPDSIFWKMAYLHGMLPHWLGGVPRHTTMKFAYPNGSFITGQATTGKAGVGGRATAMFLDEFSQIAQATQILRHTSNTSGCRVFNGTHVGVGTAFHELTLRPDMRKAVVHWSMHPEKARGLYRFDPERPTQPIILDTDYDYPPDFEFVLDGDRLAVQIRGCGRRGTTTLLLELIPPAVLRKTLTLILAARSSSSSTPSS